MPDRPDRSSPAAGPAGARPGRRRHGGASPGGRDAAPSPRARNGRAPTTLAARFAAHLRHSATLFPPDIPPAASRPILVALSGGVDSVVLLHLLRFGSERPSLFAAHFDHAMREGSAADAAWVAGLCRAWQVPLVLERAESPLRTEAQARAARYAFLERAAARTGAALVATAHQADDQAETVLFRAARGAGLRGLRGILPRRGNIVRPLLPFTRAEIEAYARSVGLRWREDPTNRLGPYARSRLRAEVLPALEDVVPGAGRALARLAAHARAAERAWELVLDDLLEGVLESDSAEAAEVAREPLLAYPSEVQSRILRHLLRRHGFAPGWAGTRAAVEFINSGTSGRSLRVAGGARLEREFDRVRIRWSGSGPAAEERSAVIERAGAGEAEAMIGGCRRAARWGEGSPTAASGSAIELFDPAAVRFPLELRGWRPGDRIRLAGGTKKLKKLFAERRLGRSARARVAVLAEANGRLLWVVGVARAPVARPVPGEPVFHVTVTDVGW